MASIHVRIDEQKKKYFQELLKSMGMDVSTAFLLYVQYVLRNHKLPFTPSATSDDDTTWQDGDCELCWKHRVGPGKLPSGFTQEQEDEMERESAWALKHGKRYDSVDELFSDMLSGDE